MAARHRLRLEDAAASLACLSERTGTERPLVHTRWSDLASSAGLNRSKSGGILAFPGSVERAALGGVAEVPCDDPLPGSAPTAPPVSEWHMEELTMPSEARTDSCMREVAEMVKSVPTLSETCHGLRKTLSRLSHAEFLAAGDFVFRAGEDARESCFLLVGCVSLQYNDASAGAEIIEIRQGSLDLGLPLVRDRISRKENARCTEDCVLLRLSRTDFQLAHTACEAEKLLDLLHKPPGQRDEVDLTEIDDKCVTQVSAFSGLDKNVRRCLARYLRPQLVQKHAILWKKDDEAEDMFVTYGAVLLHEAPPSSSSPNFPMGGSFKKTSSGSQASSPGLSSPPRSPAAIARIGSSGFKAIPQPMISRSSSVQRVLDGLVTAHPSHGEDGLASSGALVGHDGLSSARRGSTCVVRESGFVLALCLETFQGAVAAYTEAESVRKLELVKAGLDLEAALHTYSSSADKRADLMSKINACFSVRQVVRGAVLGVQRQPVEEIFIIDTAECVMRLVARFEKLKSATGDDSGTITRALVARPAPKTSKTMDIMAFGPMDCAGMTDYHMSGQWGASVHVIHSGALFVANRKRLFSVLENANCVVNCLRERQQKIIKARLRRCVGLSPACIPLNSARAICPCLLFLLHLCQLCIFLSHSV